MAMPPVIPECSADTDPDAMYGALDEAGCLVLHGMADADACERVSAELAEYVETAPEAEAVRDRLGFAMDYGDGGLGFYDRSVLAASEKTVKG